jgi:hypothetical protein
MYESIVVDARSTKLVPKSIKKLRELIKDQLDESGTFWIFCRNSFKNNKMSFTAFNLSKSFEDYFLKNIILIKSNKNQKKGLFFSDCFDQILFFSKSKNFFLDKDPIREKHIWKDVEWGKRAKNYNPKGKDPGNVWIRTEDDGKANITQHIPLNESESIERIIKCSSRKNAKICLINFNNVKDFGRKISYESF